MIRQTALGALIAGLALSASPALAQSAGDDRWSFDLGAATDNRSKNVSKTQTEGHIFGSATWESADRRFYAGPAFEGVRGNGADVEVKFTAGYTPEAYGYQFDFNIAYLNRLDAEAGYDEDAWELTGNMSRSIGPASGNLQVQYSPDPAGAATSFVWVEAELGWDFSDRLSGSAAVGRREQDGAPDYTGWNAGLTYGLTDALDLDVRYYDTNAHDQGKQYRDGLVAEVKYSF
jgi:uncharacterized protein (TIGR02001 family)